MNLIFILFLFYFICFVCSETVFKAPTYTVDLDLPPNQRWSFLSKKYRPDAQAAKDYFAKFLKGEVASIVEVIAKDLEYFMGGELAGELEGAAEALGLDTGLIVLLNYLYELRAFSGMRPHDTEGHHPPKQNQQQRESPGLCTSIVVQNTKDVIAHGRNLDWNLPAKIRAMTFKCTFVKNNATVAHGACFAGFVGMLTGLSVRGQFALSIDERHFGGNPILTGIDGILRGFWPVSHALRHVLVTSPSFDDAKQQLATIKLAAPVYFILSGTKPGEGALFSRDREENPQPLALDNTWYLLETNYDHWIEPPVYDDRRAWGLYYMNQVKQSGFDKNPLHTLSQVLAKWPIRNAFTAQNVIMSAQLNVFDVFIVDNVAVVPPPN